MKLYPPTQYNTHIPVELQAKKKRKKALEFKVATNRETRVFLRVLTLLTTSCLLVYHPNMKRKKIVDEQKGFLTSA